MFGIGMPELIIIMVIALIVIGPNKLPDLARAIGKGLAEFRKATQEIKESLNIEEDIKDAKEGLIDSISGLEEPLDLPPPRSYNGESEGKVSADGHDYDKQTIGESQTRKEGVSDTHSEKREKEDG